MICQDDNYNLTTYFVLPKRLPKRDDDISQCLAVLTEILHNILSMMQGEQQLPYFLLKLTRSEC